MAASEAGLCRLLVDRATGEVTRALGAAGIPCVLLKGPGVVRWLYAPRERRTYADTDVLVPHDRFEDAERVLASLVFRPMGRTGRHAGNASPWVREHDGACVDLHRSLSCVPASAETIWEVFSRDVVKLEVGGTLVDVPSEAVRTFHIALHAAQHGTYTTSPLRDLSLAVGRLPVEVWRRAQEVADRLDALPAFAAGLALAPGGTALARELRLPDQRTVELVLRRGHETLQGRSWGLAVDRLLKTTGWRARSGLAARALFPPPGVLRQRSRLASRGPHALALAYPISAMGVILHGMVGLAARRRALREVHASQRAT